MTMFLFIIVLLALAFAGGVVVGARQMAQQAVERDHTAQTINGQAGRIRDIQQAAITQMLDEARRQRGEP